MPAVSVFGKLNARIPYTTIKTPNNVKISNSITESHSLKAMAIFARL
jgi:hypothetical protein